ncbi:MAG: response regulator transcription factor [Lentisphaerae bacterium]|nr:response regulator transcription factor [Lentisphaerota bacterium]
MKTNSHSLNNRTTSASADSPGSAPARILIVDDHPIVRRAVHHIIKKEPDLELSWEASDANEAMHILETEKPDLAIIDISLKGRSGLDLIKDMRAQGLKCPVLVLSMHEDTTYAERSLRAGAQGYVMKNEPPQIIIDALRKIRTGDIFVCDRIATRLLSRFVGHKQDTQTTDLLNVLSDREFDVFQHIGQGQSTREIAAELNLSVSTIETHKSNIKQKLNIQTASALAKSAAEWLLGK